MWATGGGGWRAARHHRRFLEFLLFWLSVHQYSAQSDSSRNRQKKNTRYKTLERSNLSSNPCGVPYTNMRSAGEGGEGRRGRKQKRDRLVGVCRAFVPGAVLAGLGVVCPCVELSVEEAGRRKEPGGQARFEGSTTSRSVGAAPRGPRGKLKVLQIRRAPRSSHPLKKKKAKRICTSAT